MPNPVLTHIFNIRFVNTFCRYTKLKDQTVLFKQFNLAEDNNVKWFQVLLTITNNSNKHQSFAYKQINDQTVLFQAIQFSMLLVCIQFKCQTVLFDLKIRPYQVLPLRTRVDLGVMVKRGTSQSSKLQYDRSLTIRLFSVISRTHRGVSVFPFCRDVIGVFYNVAPEPTSVKEAPIGTILYGKSVWRNA